MSKIRQMFLDSAKEFTKLPSLVCTAMLIALSVALYSLTIVVNESLQISMSFLAQAAIGCLFGPVVGMAAGFQTDIIQCIVHPTGAYFPGFTLNAIVTGLIYGLFFYNKKITVIRSFLARATIMVFVHFLLTPLWCKIMYGKAFWFYLSQRIIKNLILLPIETVMLVIILKLVQQIYSKTHLHKAKS